MRVALASLDQQWEDKQANLAQCRVLAARAAELGADLIAFPEMTLTGFTMNADAVAESPVESPTIRAFTAIAREHRIAVAFGVVLHSHVRPTNCVVALGSDGVELSRYAKIHPFSYAHEDEHYDAGTTLATARIGHVAFGLTICYDLRFPELYTALAPACAAQLVIANWPAQRIAHWHALLVARAIECQCYVVAVNRTGEDANGIHYPRSSQVVDPRGEIVPPHVVEGELELVTVSAAQVARYRRSFPTLQDRKPALYGELLGDSERAAAGDRIRAAGTD